MTSITIAKGDGIGPEIMDSVLKILDAAKVDLSYDEIQVGEQLYLKGITSGIEDTSWDILKKNKVLLKAPITTPQGKGYKSLNVTIRKTLGLYSNVRPCISYAPYVATKHPLMDLVIVRENEEDLYSGVEHRLSNNVYQCLKIVTAEGSEKIIRYAFEYARKNNRKRVSAFVKDNIMKLTDGLFHNIFNEIAKEYPDIEADHYIVDIATARLADTPEMFDVIVTLNLYGDIISDVAAQIAGSVGLAGSANLSENFAMFEAIHGSAPDIAGKNMANPSGLLQAAVMMLNHLNMQEKAELIQNAWLKTIETGYHTGDIYSATQSIEKCTTQSFTDYIVSFLGQKPSKLKAAHYVGAKASKQETSSESIPSVSDQYHSEKQSLHGVDVFVNNFTDDIQKLGSDIKASGIDGLNLQMISTRGLSVWPHCNRDNLSGDFWRCRFFSDSEVTYETILKLLKNIHEKGFIILKTENLNHFNGLEGYSKAQGQ